MGVVMCNSWTGRQRACARGLMSFVLLPVVLGIARPAGAGFSIERQPVWADRARHEAHFELQFNRPPDFDTVDSSGFPRDSFQFFINPDWKRGQRDLQL